MELFGKDPEYWKTVFVSGDGLDAEIAEDKQKEKEDWEKRVCPQCRDGADLHSFAILARCVTRN